MTRFRETEQIQRDLEWSRYLAMTPSQRSQVAAGLTSLRYLLSRLPKTYRGPYATEADCASTASVDAFLERNGVNR